MGAFEGGGAFGEGGVIPKAEEEILEITAPGQTEFTLPIAPLSDASFKLYLNGNLAHRGLDYTRDGVTITWTGVTLQTSNVLVAYYNNVAISFQKEVFFPVDYASNLGNLRVRSIAGSGAFNFNFCIPDDFKTLSSAKIIGYPTAGAESGGGGKDIDLTADYGAEGEPYNQHSETDTTTTYDFTGKTNVKTEIDFSQVLTNLSAGDSGGVNVDHNAIGGGINYTGIKIKYGT